MKEGKEIKNEREEANRKRDACMHPYNMEVDKCGTHVDEAVHLLWSRSIRNLDYVS